MTNEEYFFDLNGYLIVRSVLSSDEVEACNRAIEHHSDQIRVATIEEGLEGTPLGGFMGRLGLEGLLRWPPPHGDPFRKLLTHPAAVSRLNVLCGKGFRLDYEPFMIKMVGGSAGQELHGNSEPFAPSTAYQQHEGRIAARNVTVIWQLCDVNAGDGGFAIVPGSHKSRYPRPPSLSAGNDHQGVILQPIMKAGDMLLFSGSSTHGTLPWRSARPRRSILYKYSARAIARTGGKLSEPEHLHGEWTRDLDPVQRAVLYPPGEFLDTPKGKIRAPALESDGRQVWLVPGR